jgi:hypothetical protein
MLTFFSLHSNYSFQLHKMKAWRERTKRHQPTARRHQSAIFWLQIYAELSENHVFRVLYYTNYGLKACFLSLFSDLINLGIHQGHNAQKCSHGHPRKHDDSLLIHVPIIFSLDDRAQR